MMFGVAFLWLLFGHGLADYPLQGDFLARAKNHTSPLPGVPWYQALLWHSVIHAGVVALIVHAVGAAPSVTYFCAMCELIAHVFIDAFKCGGITTFNQDQLAHIVCKAWYALIVWGAQ